MSTKHSNVTREEFSPNLGLYFGTFLHFGTYSTKNLNHLETMLIKRDYTIGERATTQCAVSSNSLYYYIPIIHFNTLFFKFSGNYLQVLARHFLSQFSPSLT